MLTLTVWAVLCSTVVADIDYKISLLPSVLILALFYMTVMVYQLLISISVDNSHKLAFFAKLIGPLFCIIMNNYKFGSFESNLLGMLVGLHY